MHWVTKTFWIINTRVMQVYQCLLHMSTRSDTSVAPLSCIHLELQDFLNPSLNHPRTFSYTPPVIAFRSKTNRLHTTYPPFHCIMSVVTRNAFFFSLLTLAREPGFWSPCAVFGAFDRHALRVAASIYNPNRTVNSRHSHLYQSAFHDVCSLNSRGYVNHEGVKRASRPENIGFHCYWWCTHEGTCWSGARSQRRKTA